MVTNRKLELNYKSNMKFVKYTTKIYQPLYIVNMIFLLINTILHSEF